MGGDTVTNVGSAYATFGLDLRSFRQEAMEVRTTLRQLQTEVEAFKRQQAAPSGARGGGGGQDTEARKRAQAIRELEQAMARQAAQERALLRGGQQIAQSEIRAATAARDYARALSLVDQQLDQAIPGTRRYNDLLAQQATLERQAAQEAQRRSQVGPPGAAPGGPSSVGGAVAGLQSAAGLLAGGGAIAGVTSFAVGAGQEALALRRTQNVLHELTGTQRNYNETLALARQNQILYGGSLQDNIKQLQGFAVAARRSGVSVQSLNELSKRLAILSPEHGAAGASIAINEALSGNVSSLVRRFEIPKALLKGIEDSSLSAAEKLKILDDALTKSGVSAGAVRNAADETSKAYNAIGAAADRAKTGLGGLAAAFFKPSQADVNILNAVADALNQAEIVENTSRNLVVASRSYDEYLARVREANEQIPFYIQHLQELTPQEFADIQAKEQLAEKQRQVNQAQAEANTINFAGTTAYEDAAKAQAGYTAATSAQAIALAEQAARTAESTLQSQQFAEVQSTLSDLGNQVAQGLITSGNAAALLAAQYGFASTEALKLIELQAQIAQQQLNKQALADQRAGERSGGQFKTEADATFAAEQDRRRAQRE